MKQRRQPFARMPIDLRARLAQQRKSGFSLVEISLALAIAAFAFVAMLGLIPSGLGNFRSAMNTQTTTEIFRRLSAEFQETDFGVLLAASVKEGGASKQFYQLPLRHFDEQGEEVRVNDPENPSTDEIARIMYTARTRGSKPGDPDPNQHSATFFTSLPGVDAPRFNPRDSTFLTVQVVLSKGRSLAPYVDGASFLVDGAMAARDGMAVKSFSLYLTRNGYTAK
jgi:uncharacterized protein (TIGR02598 family)